MNTTKEKPLIIGIGELLWDMLPTGKKAGGAPINFVYHASQMGAESYAISAIGKDLLGDEIMKEIENIDINYLIERIDYPTGTVLVKLHEGVPEYTIIENVAWDYIPMTKQLEELAKKLMQYALELLRNAQKHLERRFEPCLHSYPKGPIKFSTLIYANTSIRKNSLPTP